MISRTIH